MRHRHRNSTPHLQVGQAITFRPIHPQDEAFLCELYMSTRMDELAVLNWDTATKQAFLTMQFTAQHQYYQRYFPDAAFDLILQHGHPIGRLYVDRRVNEIRLIDIALLPAHRNSGTGTALLNALLVEAAGVQKPVRIHVEKFNPAQRLYQRLGFTIIDDVGVYFLMEWSPESGCKQPQKDHDYANTAS